MATDGTAPEPAIQRLTAEVLALSVRAAELDGELARPQGAAAYLVTAVVVGLALFVVFFWVGLAWAMAYGPTTVAGSNIYNSPGWHQVRDVARLIWLSGIALAVIVGARIVWRGSHKDERRRVQSETKRMQLASERDSAVAELSRKLKGRNLTGIDLHGKYLRGADLSSAVLSYANLHKANLAETCLSGADLGYANLYRANLQRADLSQAMLAGANLSDAMLAGANLTGAMYDNSTKWPAGFTPPADAMQVAE